MQKGRKMENMTVGWLYPVVAVILQFVFTSDIAGSISDAIAIFPWFSVPINIYYDR